REPRARPPQRRAHQRRRRRSHPQQGPMTRPEGRVAVLALDACDPDLATTLARRGRMPNLARLLARGARARVRNPYGLFVGAVWPSIATGRGPAGHGVHCWETVDLDTYERRENTQPDDWGATLWDVAGDAGRRVAVL